MKSMSKRLSALETTAQPLTGRWHRVIQEEWQTFEEALDAYEAGIGAIAEIDKLIVRRIVTP